MKALIAGLGLIAAFLSIESQARTTCRQGAISAAKHYAKGYKDVFDIKPGEETPDLISYQVTLVDTLPNPRSSAVIAVTLAKVTCGIVENPSEVRN